MSPDFYRRNRQNLQKHISSSVVILSAYDELQRGKDSSYIVEQEANFWYLCGIEASGWQLVIEPSKSWLMAPDIDDVHQIFDGSLSFIAAKKISGVDEVIPSREGWERIALLSQKYDSVATLGKDPHASHYNFMMNPSVGRLARLLKKQFKKVEDCRPILAKLRAIKQPEEIEVIRNAISLTVEAFQAFYKERPDYQHEYQAEAFFSHYFRFRGAKGHAYDPIVASGKNACTLHYTANNDQLNKNDLLLLDIGARVSGYAADITRTYALGTPSKRQKEVHAAVESAHQEIIRLLKPGLLVSDYSAKVDVIMKRAIDSLGLLKSDEDYRRYFPHAISHGLGIDVHDSLGRPTEFLPGMVLTVEPGIYIPEEGIGVRIEDDILITKNGHENLSAALPTSL